MTYKPGDIVLVNFPFTDLLSSKVKPAIVITIKGADVIILGIFSKIPEKIKESHFLIAETDEYFAKTGLKKKSIIKTEKIAVIHNSNIKRTLGFLPDNIFSIVKIKLKKTLHLE
ncbi:MAG: type II toxin-antitoxin system PemK/MazF family toxin [Nitrospirae bacterium]|nr:type II toxin-antitoxin system PemK/MazF family toxin [Nitrospirota bacterium]